MVSTGTIEITKPAISNVYCDEYSPWNWRSPTGTVREVVGADKDQRDQKLVPSSEHVDNRQGRESRERER